MNICSAVDAFRQQECRAKILLKGVSDAERFGVAEIRGNYVVGIEEKPQIQRSTLPQPEPYGLSHSASRPAHHRSSLQ
jgi:dTDP-glucose pyrophosphorylase